MEGLLWDDGRDKEVFQQLFTVNRQFIEDVRRLVCPQGSEFHIRLKNMRTILHLFGVISYLKSFSPDPPDEGFYLPYSSTEAI